MKKVVKLLLVAVLMLGLAGAAAGCGDKAQDKAGSDKQTQQTSTDKKVLKVGSETTYPPFEYVENGEYLGFDMDLIRAIADVQGYEVEIHSLGFDSLIPALKANKVDVCIAAMSIDEERKKSVDFSEPYCQGGLVIAVAEKTEGISTLDDLKGKKLAAQIGTTGADQCQTIKEADPKTPEVKLFKGIGEAFMELVKGGADAVVNDHLVTAYYIQSQGKGKVKMVGDVFAADEQYGIAVKKGNTEMLNLMNDGLKKIKDNGEYDKIYTKWFGEQK